MAFKFPEKKLFYSIREVSEILDIKPHIIRHWETEFPQLQPRKNRGGARLFREEDMKILQSLKRLIVDEHFTIEGARQRLNEGYRYDRDEKDLLRKYKRRVYAIKKSLNELMSIINQPPENFLDS